MILNRSTVGDKSFLAHVKDVFKLKRKLTSTLARDLKSESLNENHLVTAHTSKNDTQHLIGRTVFFKREKSDTRHLIGFQLLSLACERKSICAFSVGKSRYVYNKV